MRDALQKASDWLQKTIAPDLQYSQYAYESGLREQVRSDTRWLDLGCGHKVLPPWRFEQEQHLVAKCSLVVGLDPVLRAVKAHRTIVRRVQGDITRLPFLDQSFDLVTANMVVEHLPHPAVQFMEVQRVLRPGGIFMFHTPNVFGYTTMLSRLVPEESKRKVIKLIEGRNESDVFPTFYRVNTHRDICAFAATCGFDVVAINLIPSSVQFRIFPPLALLELLWIRLLMLDSFKGLRTNLIGILRKRAAAVD